MALKNPVDIKKILLKEKNHRDFPKIEIKRRMNLKEKEKIIRVFNFIVLMLNLRGGRTPGGGGSKRWIIIIIVIFIIFIVIIVIIIFIIIIVIIFIVIVIVVIDVIVVIVVIIILQITVNSFAVFTFLSLNRNETNSETF